MTDETVQTIAINAQGHIFAGTNSDLFRPNDNGTSWDRLKEEFTTPVYAIGINSSDHLFATFINYGVYRSTDTGVSWESIHDGLATNHFQKSLALQQTSMATSSPELEAMVSFAHPIGAAPGSKSTRGYQKSIPKGLL